MANNATKLFYSITSQLQKLFILRLFGLVWPEKQEIQLNSYRSVILANVFFDPIWPEVGCMWQLMGCQSGQKAKCYTKTKKLKSRVCCLSILSFACALSILSCKGVLSILSCASVLLILSSACALLILSCVTLFLVSCNPVQPWVASPQVTVYLEIFAVRNFHDFRS